MERTTLDMATRRLASAIDALEAAVDRRLAAAREGADLAAQVQALGEDRVRLAHSLDVATARSERLAQANREVSRRLDQAITVIRSVVEGRDDVPHVEVRNGSVPTRG